MIYRTPTQATAAKQGRESELQRIKDVQERTGTFDRLNGFMLSIRVVLYILIAWSILTESGFLFPQLFYFTGSKLLAGTVLVMVVVIIEGIKFSGGALMMRMFVNNWFSDAAHYWGFGALIFLIVGTAYVGSAFFSIKGAPEIPTAVDRVNSKVELIDIQAIHDQYDQRLEAERGTIAAASNMTWQGRITRRGQDIIDRTQATIAEIEAQRSEELIEAQEENNRRQSTHDSGLLNIGAWLGALGGIGEFLTLICLLLQAAYNRAVYKEIPEAPETAVQKSTAAASQKPSSGGSGGQSVPPSGPVPVTPNGRTVHAVPKGPVPESVPTVLNGAKTLSEQIGTPIASSSGDSAGNSVEVYLEDSHTILHMGEDGTEKRYTLRDVKGMIRKYKARIDTYRKKVQAGTATDKTQQAIANCTNHIQYWQGRLKEFMLPA